MAARSDTPGHRSKGIKPYAARKKAVAKKPAAKKTASKVKTSSPLVDAVESLDADRRSTPQERRRVILEALRLSTRLAEDSTMPPSARTAALVQVKALSEQLIRIDELDPDTVLDAFGSRRPVAT